MEWIYILRPFLTQSPGIDVAIQPGVIRQHGPTGETKDLAPYPSKRPVKFSNPRRLDEMDVE
jgi:hypothetical protein